MSIDYVGIKNDLTECLVKLEVTAKTLGCGEGVVEPLAAARRIVASRQYNVAVMGEFNRGKSSLINALLGGRILPEAIVPATATINRVTYGMEESSYAVAQYVDGSSERVPIGELRDYVTKLSKRHEEVSSKVREVTVFTPSVICQNRIDLIDTPGLNEDERMTDITLRLVGEVDAVIVPLHALAPFSDSERDFLIKLVEADNIRHVLFVVTFMDQLDEDDYDYKEYMAYIRMRILSQTEAALGGRTDFEEMVSKFHAKVGSLEISGVSAKLALDAFAAGNRKGLKASRFEDFRMRLMQMLTAQQAENAICSALEAVERSIAQMEHHRVARENEIEAQIQHLGDVSALVARVEAQHLHGALDDMLSLAEAKMENRFGMLMRLRLSIKRIFVAQLSGVRQNTHSAIKGALDHAAASAVQLLNEQYQLTQAKLLQELEEAFGILEEAEQAADDALAAQGLAVHTDFAQEKARLQKRASWVFGSFEFQGEWLKECSAAKNLALPSVSPMDLAAKDIDGLLSRYWTAIKSKEAQLISEWRDMVLEGHDTRMAQAQAAARRRAHDLRVRLEFERGSWSAHKAEMDAVQERCESIRGELAGENRLSKEEGLGRSAEERAIRRGHVEEGAIACVENEGAETGEERGA